MSAGFYKTISVAAIAAAVTMSSQALAQSDDADLEMRIQRLENQLRQLTGQNEELQYRNRQLEERLRQLQGAGLPGAPAGGQPNVAAVPNDVDFHIVRRRQLLKGLHGNKGIVECRQDVRRYADLINQGKG